MTMFVMTMIDVYEDDDKGGGTPRNDWDTDADCEDYEDDADDWVMMMQRWLTCIPPLSSLPAMPSTSSMIRTCFEASWQWRDGPGKQM